jgi:hypothetical protein
MNDYNRAAMTRSEKHDVSFLQKKPTGDPVRRANAKKRTESGDPPVPVEMTTDARPLHADALMMNKENQDHAEGLTMKTENRDHAEGLMMKTENQDRADGLMMITENRDLADALTKTAKNREKQKRVGRKRAWNWILSAK